MEVWEYGAQCAQSPVLLAVLVKHVNLLRNGGQIWCSVWSCRHLLLGYCWPAVKIIQKEFFICCIFVSNYLKVRHVRLFLQSLDALLPFHVSNDISKFDRCNPFSPEIPIICPSCLRVSPFPVSGLVSRLIDHRSVCPWPQPTAHFLFHFPLSPHLMWLQEMHKTATFLWNSNI